MNLTERLGEKRILWCPFSEAGACVIKNADGESVREPNECAYYNPKSDECIHVEAARALVGIAEWAKRTFDSPLEQKRVITLERSIEPEYEEYCGPFWTCPACGGEFITPDSRYCPVCGGAIERVGDWVGDTDD